MNVEQLAQAVGMLEAKDALPCKLSLDDWKALAPYLSGAGDSTGHRGL